MDGRAAKWMVLSLGVCDLGYPLRWSRKLKEELAKSRTGEVTILGVSQGTFRHLVPRPEEFSTQSRISRVECIRNA